MNYHQAVSRVQVLNKDISKAEAKVLKLRAEKKRLLLVFKKLREIFPR